MANLPHFAGDNGRAPIPAGFAGPYYAYGFATACNGAEPGEQGADASCNKDVIACRVANRGPGPLTSIWRREVTATGADIPGEGWVKLGVTCWTDVLPGNKPRVTMAQILTAFKTTPFAKTQVSTQPVGNVTLVGLPVYYQVSWATDGFQPGEVDKITLLGTPVQIRPTLQHFTYDFGDGEVFGPTTYLGGVYPTGSITHPYTQPGTYATRVLTTFGGDFSMDGGVTWDPIPAHAPDVPGAPTVETVRTATNRLVAH